MLKIKLFTIYPYNVKNTSMGSLSNNRLFASLSILIFLSDKFELELPVKKTIDRLFDRYSYLPFCIKAEMGFPENYESVWLWGDEG